MDHFRRVSAEVVHGGGNFEAVEAGSDSICSDLSAVLGVMKQPPSWLHCSLPLTTACSEEKWNDVKSNVDPCNKKQKLPADVNTATTWAMN